jgi:hypothetical protein
MNLAMFLQTGLRISYKKVEQKAFLAKDPGSSMGISIRISNAKETIKGILTTRHNLENFKSCYYSISNTEDIEAADVVPCISAGIVDLFKDYYYINLSQSLSVETDFVIVKFKHDFTFGINEKLSDNSFNMIPINQIASLEMISSLRSLVVCKSGSTTGQTEGVVLGSLYQFYEIDELKNIQDDELCFENSLYVRTIEKDHIEKCDYLLVYDQSNSFAARGDSGGLCWFRTPDEKACAIIGIIMSRLVDRLFLVLPLDLIKQAYEKLGYEVHFDMPASDSSTMTTTDSSDSGKSCFIM